MGDRYILTVICPKCGFEDSNVYYAPTCGFIDWSCPKCNHKVDLAEYTGITYEDVSNANMIKDMIEDIKEKK